jgi:hypothetical protein
MNSFVLIFLMSGWLIAGCATKTATGTSKTSTNTSSDRSQVVTVVAQVKYQLSAVPPQMAWSEIYGDEAALEAAGRTNADGVILEILEPKEFAGKIYTLRDKYAVHDANQSFAIGSMYEFRAIVASIGKFDFRYDTSVPARRLSTGEAKQKLDASSSPRRDDLMWLVGRWRCVTREWLVNFDPGIGGGYEDSVDYFNVYFPYADDELTLELTDRPDDRPIAAEFLVRLLTDWYDQTFKEYLGPMTELGPVSISKDRIQIGDPFHRYIFRYYRRDGRWGPILVLESKAMHLEFYKLRAAVGDIKDSFVEAPIKAYPAERISELKQRYEKMCAATNNPPGSAK